MNRQTLLFLLSVICAAVTAQNVHAHCQVPCGIYDDAARFKAMKEHVTTLEKAMKTMALLEPNSVAGKNQIARWVLNKERHAEELSEIVSYYFLAQRIKIPKTDDVGAQKKYAQQVILLHQILVYTMKTKQTTDLDHVAKLRGLIDAFELAYTGKKPHKH